MRRTGYPPLHPPVRLGATYFERVLAFLLALKLGRAAIQIVSAGLSVLLTILVLGVCSLIAYFRV